jgi:U32 family peptidase
MATKMTAIFPPSVEIMAPAGCFESLMAALQAGADSVYFGVGHLNMRARAAGNFELADLPEIVQRCRQHGVKCYLTLNTILYDHDMKLMRRMVDAAARAGVDAIIAADVAAIMYARSLQLPIHISTQANVCNYETVQFYAAFADIMVLARELTLQQMEAIVKAIRRDGLTGPSGQQIRIEVFAHGALCMAVSGKCYLSLHSHNSSANRGACKQNCRQKYKVTDEEGHELEIDNEYIMSAKDLATISFLDKLVHTGISVLKIEGRGRGPEYVKEVTACYKEAVQSLQQGTYTREKIEAWTGRLQTVYNRGLWEGYYLGRKLGEWADTGGSKATKVKVYLGRGRKYFATPGVAEFVLESGELQLGDEVLITGPTTGLLQLQVEELRQNLQAVASVGQGAVFSMPVPDKVRSSDKLYKLINR